jgi:protein-L-isoaspartate(D-aspartate) O-methyltransferase
MISRGTFVEWGTWGAALMIAATSPGFRGNSGEETLCSGPTTVHAIVMDAGQEPASPLPDSIRSWWPPRPRSARERTAEREKMVLDQIETPGWSRDVVTDPAVLRAMRGVPRHAFVPREVQKQAYNDTPLPIGHGQTISQPYMVAIMTELLRLTPESRVLEIGTGSGYQAAVLAHLTPHVFTIEIIEPLAKRAADTLAGEGYTGVHVRPADGYYGWPEAGPFDAIIVTCASGHLPPPLWDQIKPGGRIVIPIGGSFSIQRLVVVEKTEDGKRRTESVMGVRFVPMTGQAAGN